MIEEAIWELKSAINQDVKRYYDGDALSVNISEWLATPEGTVAHNPSWGNNLIGFKFEPLSNNNTDLEVMIELAIARKLPIDIEGLVLLGVRCEMINFDLCKITIIHQYKAESYQVSL